MGTPLWVHNEQDVIPIYSVHQIGFIPPTAGPCLRLIVPNGQRLWLVKTGSKKNFECESSNCLDERITSVAPSCIGDGSNVSCLVLMSHCEQLTSFT